MKDTFSFWSSYILTIAILLCSAQKMIAQEAAPESIVKPYPIYSNAKLVSSTELLLVSNYFGPVEHGMSRSFYHEKSGKTYTFIEHGGILYIMILNDKLEIEYQNKYSLEANLTGSYASLKHHSSFINNDVIQMIFSSKNEKKVWHCAYSIESKKFSTSTPLTFKKARFAGAASSGQYIFVAAIQKNSSIIQAYRWNMDSKKWENKTFDFSKERFSIDLTAYKLSDVSKWAYGVVTFNSVSSNDMEGHWTFGDMTRGMRLTAFQDKLLLLFDFGNSEVGLRAGLLEMPWGEGKSVYHKFDYPREDAFKGTEYFYGASYAKGKYLIQSVRTEKYISYIIYDWQTEKILKKWIIDEEMLKTKWASTGIYSGLKPKKEVSYQAFQHLNGYDIKGDYDITLAIEKEEEDKWVLFTGVCANIWVVVTRDQYSTIRELADRVAASYSSISINTNTWETTPIDTQPYGVIADNWLLTKHTDVPQTSGSRNLFKNYYELLKIIKFKHFFKHKNVWYMGYYAKKDDRYYIVRLDKNGI